MYTPPAAPCLPTHLLQCWLQGADVEYYQQLKVCSLFFLVPVYCWVGWLRAP